MSLAPGVAALFAIHRLRAEAAFLDRLNRGSGFADPRYPDPGPPAGSRRGGPPRAGRAQALQHPRQGRRCRGRGPRDRRWPPRRRRRSTRWSRAAPWARPRPPWRRSRSRSRSTTTPASWSTPWPAAGAPACTSTSPPSSTRGWPRRRRALAAAGPRSPLVDAGLLLVDADGGLVRSHPRLAAWALGEPALPPPLDEVATLGSADAIWLPPTVVAEAARIAQVIGEVEAPTAVLVLGPRGSGRRAVAARLAAHRGRPIVTAALPDLLAASGDRTAPLRLLLGEARLRDAVPVLTDADALAGERDGERAALAAIGRGPPLVILAASGRGLTNLPLGRPFHLVRMPRADLDDRAAAWSAALEAVAADRALAPELAAATCSARARSPRSPTEAATFARPAAAPSIAPPSRTPSAVACRSASAPTAPCSIARPASTRWSCPRTWSARSTT
jgi:hypothetical protein